jgi:hypothetical protein
MLLRAEWGESCVTVWKREDGRLRHIVGLGRERFSSRLNFGERGGFNGEWPDKSMLIRPSDYFACMATFICCYYLGDSYNIRYIYIYIYIYIYSIVNVCVREGDSKHVV